MLTCIVHFTQENPKKTAVVHFLSMAIEKLRDFKYMARFLLEVDQGFFM